jgi:pyridoxal phosphate enzyme (YggS family)
VSDAVHAATLRSRLARVHERIDAAGGDPARITVVAVTKAFGAPVVRLALDAGLRNLGENYAQEMLDKVAALGSSPPATAPAPAWHFLGRLQTNKVRLLARHVTRWHSVDRSALVHEIAKRAPGAGVLVQINLSGEPQKGGCPFAEVPALVGLARDEGLDVHGLMGVGPAGDPAAARPGFERLVALADALELPERSIGMSADLEVAVRAGATVVRIGRDLFGGRPVVADLPEG